jgi:hypothetical protein
VRSAGGEVGENRANLLMLAPMGPGGEVGGAKPRGDSPRVLTGGMAFAMVAEIRSKMSSLNHLS